MPTKEIMERFRKCSPLAQEIARELLAGDFLQMPRRMQGWGLAAFRNVMIAERIDEVLGERAIIPVSVR